MDKRTAKQWEQLCQSILGGYTPGGSKEATYYTGILLADFLYQHGVWREGDTIVDLGCGNGRLAMGLYARDAKVTYVGLEIIKPSVDFCVNAFAGIGGYSFKHVDVHNQHYWAKGKINPLSVQYPVETHSADVVIAQSVFSHTGTIPVAKHIYAEAVRMCTKEGRVFTTWFFGQPVTDESKTVYDKAAVYDWFGGEVTEVIAPNFLSGQTGILCNYG